MREEIAKFIQENPEIMFLVGLIVLNYIAFYLFFKTYGEERHSIVATITIVDTIAILFTFIWCIATFEEPFSSWFWSLKGTFVFFILIAFILGFGFVQYLKWKDRKDKE